MRSRKAEREPAPPLLRIACIVELLKRHRLASSEVQRLAEDASRLRTVLLALSTYDARRANDALPKGLRRPRGRPRNAGGKIMIYLGELASIYEHCSSAAGTARRATVNRFVTAAGETRWGRFPSFAADCFFIAGHDITEQGLAKAWESRDRSR